jgi:hypothetical protein
LIQLLVFVCAERLAPRRSTRIAAPSVLTRRQNLIVLKPDIFNRIFLLRAAVLFWAAAEKVFSLCLQKAAGW